jgi:hypothetical protein
MKISIHKRKKKAFTKLYKIKKLIKNVILVEKKANGMCGAIPS